MINELSHDYFSDYYVNKVLANEMNNLRL